MNLGDYQRCVEELKDQLFGALREDETRMKTRSENGYNHHPSTAVKLGAISGGVREPVGLLGSVRSAPTRRVL